MAFSERPRVLQAELAASAPERQITLTAHPEIDLVGIESTTEHRDMECRSQQGDNGSGPRRAPGVP